MSCVFQNEVDIKIFFYEDMVIISRRYAFYTVEVNGDDLGEEKNNERRDQKTKVQLKKITKALKH